MSAEVKASQSKRWTAGSGLFLIVMSLAVVVFAWENFFALGIAWFSFLIGIALLFMGLLGDQQLQKKGSVEYREITREVVKLRCSHCGSLNLEASNRCSNCGANL